MEGMGRAGVVREGVEMIQYSTPIQNYKKLNKGSRVLKSDKHILLVSLRSNGKINLSLMVSFSSSAVEK